MINNVRKLGEALRKKAAQAKQLQFLCCFLRGSRLAKIIKLTLNRGLPEILGITEKCEMGLPNKCGQYGRDEQQHQPGGIDHNRDRPADSRDHLQLKPPDGLDHHQPVCRLYTGALQAVVENGIFVSCKIQSRGVLHHLNADVTRVLISKQRVGVINHPRDDAAQNGKPEFGAYQPP